MLSVALSHQPEQEGKTGQEEERRKVGTPKRLTKTEMAMSGEDTGGKDFVCRCLLFVHGPVSLLSFPYE